MVNRRIRASAIGKTCRLLFVLVILAHDRRRVVHVAITEHPTATWTVQQLREAFPWDEVPRYLLRDRDHAFDGLAGLEVPSLRDRERAVNIGSAFGSMK